MFYYLMKTRMNQVNLLEEPFQYVRLKIRQKSTQVSDYLKYLGEDIIFKEIFPQKALVKISQMKQK